MSGRPFAPDSASNAEKSGQDQAEAASALGQRIRDLRKESRMTLEQASAATGLSRAALSKIERGEMSPTYDSLGKLAEGFRIDLAALISGHPQDFSGFAVTRAKEGAVQETERFVHQLLAPDFGGRALYVFETQVLATKFEDYDQWDRHDSEDLLYVLEGAVVVRMKGHAPVELGVGDSLQMDGRIPHEMIAVAAEDAPAGSKVSARLLWISVPSRR